MRSMSSEDRQRKPPSCQSSPTVPKGAAPVSLIVGDVVDLELAGMDVAQHKIRFAGAVNRADPGELPIQADSADEGCARELVVIDVVHFQSASIDVAQQQIGFAGDAAEIADARELPVQTDGADEGRARDLIVVDVVDLQSAGIGVAQDHIRWCHGR